VSVRPSVRQSVRPISQTQQRRAAGLLLSAVRAKDIGRQRQAPGSSSNAGFKGGHTGQLPKASTTKGPPRKNSKKLLPKET